MPENPVKSTNIGVFPKKLWIHNSALTDGMRRPVGFVGNISYDTDMNDIIIPGVYAYGGESIGGPPTNAPSSGHAIILVFRANDYGAQFWIKDREEAGARNLYFRKGHSLYNPSGSRYWQTVVTLDLL